MAMKMPGGAKDPRKKAAPAKSEKLSVGISKRAPKLNAMSVGAANAPMPPAAGLRAAGPMGMKKGGMCGGGKAKGYAKGGSIDGIASKGKTKGQIC